MIKIIWYTLISLILLIGCDSDEIKENINDEFEITSITPLRVKIGDTITISGRNLDKLSEFSIQHDDDAPFEHRVRFKQFPSDLTNGIKIKIPKLYYEKATIDFPFGTSFKLEIVGIIPLETDFENLSQIQIIDNNLAYVLQDDKIYKSIDGFYTWTDFIEFSGQFISSFFFIDENNGWVGVKENGIMNIYYTQDGGITMSLKHQVGNAYGGNFIRKIRFSSISKGYFVTNRQEMYVSHNDSFENIHDYFPNLSSTALGEFKIWDFKMVNDDLIFLIPISNSNLVKINRQNVTLTEFETWPVVPYFFKNTGYIQVNSDIYKTIDLGNSWIKIKTFENRYPELYFINNQEGFAFVNSYPFEIYRTKNSGVTWEKYFTFSQYEAPNYRDFNQTTGLLANGRKKLWKYRKD